MDETLNVKKAKAKLWKAIHDTLCNLDDIDRASVAHATRNVLEPIVLLSARGKREVVDYFLDGLNNVDAMSKQYRGEKNND